MDRKTFLENYRDIRQIGHGGTGVIYRAYHRNLGKYVVLKKLIDGSASHIMRREVDILKNLRHRYLPQVYDYIEIDHTVFVVEDYIQGKDLDFYIKAGYHIPEEQIVRWLRQLCEVLDYLHSRKPAIVHSDIKPGNIMVDEHGDVCLIDFNISFLREIDRSILGFSPHFCSPEQMRLAHNNDVEKIKIDQRSDLYSLAATFYALLSRQMPSCERENRPLSQMRLPYSEGLCRLLDRAMQPNPDRRFHSARQMLHLLQHMERLTERYQTYARLRMLVSAVGVLLVCAGILCMVKGVQVRTEQAFVGEFRQVSSAYQLSGATESVKADAMNLLEDSAYETVLDSHPETRAELLTMAGEYFYRMDSDYGYRNAQEYYQQALAAAAEAEEDDLEEYVMRYAGALAFGGKTAAAEQTAAQYGVKDPLVLAAIEAQCALQDGDYAQVLRLAQDSGNAAGSAAGYALAQTACQAAQRLSDWDSAIRWSEAMVRENHTDETVRQCAQLYLRAANAVPAQQAAYLAAASRTYQSISVVLPEDQIALADLDYMQKRYTAALRLLSAVQTEDPLLRCRIEYRKALNLVECGDAEQAKIACAKAIQCYNRLSEEDKKQADRSALALMQQKLGVREGLKP